MSLQLFHLPDNHIGNSQMIRKLDKAEFQQATTLALEVYLQCGQDDFEDEGLESFKRRY